MNLKGFGRKRPWPNLSSYTGGICVYGLKKTMKDLSQDSRSPGRDLNSGPPEYEGVLDTRPRRSIFCLSYPTLLYCLRLYYPIYYIYTYLFICLSVVHLSTYPLQCSVHPDGTQRRSAALNPPSGRSSSITAVKVTAPGEEQRELKQYIIVITGSKHAPELTLWCCEHTSHVPSN
jgi:hypothetical protein